jgi:hypothetical protein
MKSLQYYLQLDKLSKQTNSTTEKKTSQIPMGETFKQHFLQSIAAFKFVSKLRIPTDEFMYTIKVQLAQLSKKKASKFPPFKF